MSSPNFRRQIATTLFQVSGRLAWVRAMAIARCSRKHVARAECDLFEPAARHARSGDSILHFGNCRRRSVSCRLSDFHCLWPCSSGRCWHHPVCSASGSLNQFSANPLTFDLLVMCLVSGLLGPGALSLDAHLFGRRKVVIRRSSHSGISGTSNLGILANSRDSHVGRTLPSKQGSSATRPPLS